MKYWGECCSSVPLQSRDLFYTFYFLKFPTNKYHKLLNQGPQTMDNYSVTENLPQCLQTFHVPYELSQNLSGKHCITFLLLALWRMGTGCCSHTWQHYLYHRKGYVQHPVHTYFIPNTSFVIMKRKYMSMSWIICTLILNVPRIHLSM
jgi:hypothetical protein